MLRRPLRSGGSSRRSSRRTTTRPSPACSRRISDVPSIERWSVTSTTSTPAREVIAEPGVDDVCLVPDEQRHRDSHQGSAGARRRRDRSRRSSRRRTRVSSAATRGSSSSSLRRIRTRSASPSTAASTAKAASSAAVGRGKASGASGLSPRRRSASRSRVSSTSRPRCEASARSGCGTRELGEDLGAPARSAVAVGERVVRRPRPGDDLFGRRRTSSPRLPRAHPCGRAARACGSGSGAPRSGTSLVEGRSRCHRPSDFPRRPRPRRARGGRSSGRAARGCAGR